MHIHNKLQLRNPFLLLSQPPQVTFIDDWCIINIILYIYTYIYVYIYIYIQKSQELLKRLRHNQLQGKREPWAPQARAPICKKGKSLPIFWLRFYLWHSLEIGILSKTLFFNLQIFPFTFEDFHLFPECSTSITFRLCWLINYLYSLDQNIVWCDCVLVSVLYLEISCIITEKV